MTDVRAEPPRRVGLIAPAPSEVPAPRSAADTKTPQERLLAALDEVSARVRSGELGSDPAGGVLLDTTVDEIRCVIVEQRPSLEVGLSPREQQVALMVANGRTNQAIAAALEISVWTVSTHLRRIFAKLAVSSRAQMVAHLREQTGFAAALDPGEPYRGKAVRTGRGQAGGGTNVADQV
jgi:DNA-binding CsgD family transcriptional regulator